MAKEKHIIVALLNSKVNIKMEKDGTENLLIKMEMYYMK